MVADFSINKGDEILWINQRYNYYSDTFFKYFTYLGDGVVFVPLVILLIWVRLGYALLFAITGVALALVSNILKHAVFPHKLRPNAWFAGQDITLNVVEGVEIYNRNAFPSGHTATAAAVGLLLAFMFRSRIVTAIALIYALLVGFSRVYLVQHFLDDAAFGFLEGIIVAAVVYRVSRATWGRESLS